MKKIYITLTSIILIVSLALSLIVSRSIVKEFDRRSKAIRKLDYIKSLNNKIEIINDIYSVSNKTKTINEQIIELTNSINSIKLENDKVKTDNIKLKLILDDFKK